MKKTILLTALLTTIMISTAEARYGSYRASSYRSPVRSTTRVTPSRSTYKATTNRNRSYYNRNNTSINPSSNSIITPTNIILFSLLASSSNSKASDVKVDKLKNKCYLKEVALCKGLEMGISTEEMVKALNKGDK